MPETRKQASALRQPVDWILGRETHVRILRALVQHGEYLSRAQIETATNLPTRTVNYALGRLADTGVLKTAGTSTVRMFAFAPAHPLSPMLHGLFESEAARFRNLVRAISDVAETQSPSVKAVWLYGSVARKEDRFDSDVDIAVFIDDVNGPAIRENVLTELDRIGERFAVSISPIMVTLADLEQAVAHGDPWWQTIRDEARTLNGQRPIAVETEVKRQTFMVQ